MSILECKKQAGGGIGKGEDVVGGEEGVARGLATYVAIPVVMMYTFANNSENLEKIIHNVSLSLFVLVIALKV